MLTFVRFRSVLRTGTSLAEKIEEKGMECRVFVHIRTQTQSLFMHPQTINWSSGSPPKENTPTWPSLVTTHVTYQLKLLGRGASFFRDSNSNLNLVSGESQQFPATPSFAYFQRESRSKLTSFRCTLKVAFHYAIFKQRECICGRRRCLKKESKPFDILHFSILLRKLGH